MPMYHDTRQMWKFTLHTLYTTHVSLNYKTIFFVEREIIYIDTCQSPSFCLLFEPLLPCDLAHMHCDVRRVVRDTSDESGQLCTLCPKQVRESEYRTLIQCFAFDHIRPCFPHIFNQAQSLHEFLSQPQCALSIATFLGKVLEHRESLVTFTCIT